jgi:hypothetical protein
VGWARIVAGIGRYEESITNFGRKTMGKSDYLGKAKLSCGDHIDVDHNNKVRKIVNWI